MAVKFAEIVPNQVGDDSVDQLTKNMSQLSRVSHFFKNTKCSAALPYSAFNNRKFLYYAYLKNTLKRPTQGYSFETDASDESTDCSVRSVANGVR